MSCSSRGIHAQMGIICIWHDKESASRSPGGVASRIRAPTRAEARKGPALYGTTYCRPKTNCDQCALSETGQRRGAAHNTATETAATIGADRLRGVCTKGRNRSIEWGGGEMEGGG